MIGDASAKERTIWPREKKVPFSMPIENGELMQECFPNHSRMGTSRIKQDKETDEEGEYGRKQSEQGKKKSRRPITS